MNPDRVKLASIRSLTFYAGELTTARRTAPVDQLVCEGAPCRRFQPDVVRCTNAGGAGTDVDWTCKAELPERFRFGRVNVGCEGWSKPGDEYVLKGSCQLTYKLVEIPRDGDRGNGGSRDGGGWDVSSVVFGFIWLAILGFIVFSFVRSCLRQRTTRLGPEVPINRPGGDGPGGYGTDAPPPYTDVPPPGPPTSGKPGAPGSGSAPPAEGWRPGFWTGTGVGALGAHLWNNMRTNDGTNQRDYDWEQERWGNHRRANPGGFGRRGHHHHNHHHNNNNNDRGEGSSGLGRMQTSTGFGGSSVR